MDNKQLLAIEYLSKKYDETNIPLYLSYPTAAWWRSSADERSFSGQYAAEDSPFLYFHFPYCKKACYYCCCHKEVTADPAAHDRYLDYLEKEISLKLSVLSLSRFNGVRHMHWGGGTPTEMRCDQMERFFNALLKKAELQSTADASISIEAYPDGDVLTLEKLHLVRSLGFNEISLGIQDFDERIRKVINRDGSVETVQLLVHQAKELGFRVHVDLCYGLPFQGMHELEHTVRHVIAMDPDRIAVFPYAHYPLQFPLQRKIPASAVPNSFMKILLAQKAEELFTAGGYKRVGIDHFVKPENALYQASKQRNVVRDFMGYSVIGRRRFLGFGCSAVSYSGNALFRNARALPQYYSLLDRHMLPFETNHAHFLSFDDTVRNRVIQKNILSDFEMDTEALDAEFSIDSASYFKKELAALEGFQDDGLVECIDQNRIAITPTGTYVARHIARVFDAYYR